MRLFKEQKGTVTIYLAVIFMAMIVFTGVFIDLARIRLAQNQLRRITNSAARSVMANYSTFLKNDYGLFVINDSVDYQGEFRKYIKVNLSGSTSGDFNLLGGKYEDSEVVLSEPLGNLAALKRQVLEDMKYTAPIEISRDLINKFRAIGNLTRFFGEQNQKRKVIKSVNTKISDIGEINGNIRAKRETLKRDKLLLKSTNEQISLLKGSDEMGAAAQRKSLEKQKNELLRQIARSKEEISTAINSSKEKSLEIQQEIDQLANRIDSRNDGLQNAVGPLDNEIQNNLNNFKRENFDALVADLQEIKNNTIQAETALAGVKTDDVVNEMQFSKLELDPANRIYDKYKNSTVSGDQAILQKLAVNRNVYMNGLSNNQLLRNSKIPEEQVANIIDYRSADEADQKLDTQEQMLNQISGILSVDQKLTYMRNELYLNEYLLTHCSYITGEPKGSAGYDKRSIEAEYVVYGSHALEKAIGELYMTRFTLDTLGYLVFSKPPAPVELLSRTIYSLIMGALQASVDTYKLLADGTNTVSVIEMMPDNPMEKLNLTLTYKDHLRLFMLLHSDEQSKLKRLMEVIKQRNSIEPNKAFTLLDGSAVVSIQLWFLPLTGLSNTLHGPFDTEIRNGRCYITKTVEFGY